MTSYFEDLLSWLIMSYHFRFCNHFFFFKQKTAYDMRISDWSSDVSSSDLTHYAPGDSMRRLGWRNRPWHIPKAKPHGLIWPRHGGCSMIPAGRGSTAIPGFSARSVRRPRRAVSEPSPPAPPHTPPPANPHPPETLARAPHHPRPQSPRP